MGEPLPAKVVAGDWWNEGRAVYGALRLANGARCDGAWIQLLDTFEYRETISLFFDGLGADARVPLAVAASSTRPCTGAAGATAAPTTCGSCTSYDESFARELRHFHACIVDGDAVPDAAGAARARHRRADADVPRRRGDARRDRRQRASSRRVHAIALRAIGVEVAAVCGRTLEGARGLRRGARPTTISASCSTPSRSTSLHVCTPNDVHAAQALAAIERGVHVVCEKPLAVSTAESRAMVEAAAASGARARDLLPRARLPARRADARRRRRRRGRARSRSSTAATSATTSSSRPRAGASTRRARGRRTSSATSAPTGSTSPST